MQEIAMSILDIAYNSIRANASLIKILIHDSNNLNIINIQIIDNGKGMEQATIKKVIDPFYTTRTTRKVGLGIPMFKENIEATGGKFSIESTINVGTKVEGELIQADDKIDYLFKYTSDNFEFVLDTKEIKKILDGIPINLPDVIIWLKDYIKEGLHK